MSALCFVTLMVRVDCQLEQNLELLRPLGMPVGGYLDCIMRWEGLATVGGSLLGWDPRL